MEDRLQKFAALADAGSFTRAATELHLSQPALSMAVRKLEREVGAALIVHGVRPLKLTPAGNLAYVTAKELAVSTDNLKLRVAELTQADIKLRIGMIDSIAGSVFADAPTLEGFGQRVRLSVMVNNSRTLLQAVEHDELDVAFIADPPPTLSPSLLVRHLADEPLVAVCSPEQAAAFQEALAHGQLPQFISYDQQSTTSRLVAETLHRQGLAVTPHVYSTSPEVMLRLVRLRQGAAVLPYPMVAPFIERNELSIIGRASPGVIPRGISLAQRRDKELPAPLNRLVRQVRRSLDGLMADAERLVSTDRA